MCQGVAMDNFISVVEYAKRKGLSRDIVMSWVRRGLFKDDAVCREVIVKRYFIRSKARRPKVNTYIRKADELG